MPAINPLSARYVAICSAAVTDGAFFTSDDCVAIGVLADGSETPPPDPETFTVMVGDVEVSANLAHTYRIAEFVKGDIDAVKAIRNTSGAVAAVINKGATNYTNYGPGVVSAVTPLGNNVSNEPGGARVAFNATEDHTDELVSLVAQAATIAAAV